MRANDIYANGDMESILHGEGTNSQVRIHAHGDDNRHKRTTRSIFMIWG